MTSVSNRCFQTSPRFAKCGFAMPDLLSASPLGQGSL
jgi:hypothetical protein